MNSQILNLSLFFFLFHALMSHLLLNSQYSNDPEPKVHLFLLESEPLLYPASCPWWLPISSTPVHSQPEVWQNVFQILLITTKDEQWYNSVELGHLNRPGPTWETLDLCTWGMSTQWPRTRWSCLNGHIKARGLKLRRHSTNARFQNFAADAAKTTAVLHAVFGFFLTFVFTEAY